MPAAKALRKRTLTNLYNARPQWLADAHAALDAAVAGAYGWPADISGDDAIRELIRSSSTAADSRPPSAAKNSANVSSLCELDPT